MNNYVAYILLFFSCTWITIIIVYFLYVFFPRKSKNEEDKNLPKVKPLNKEIASISLVGKTQSINLEETLALAKDVPSDDNNEIDVDYTSEIIDEKEEELEESLLFEDSDIEVSSNNLVVRELSLLQKASTNSLSGEQEKESAKEVLSKIQGTHLMDAYLENLEKHSEKNKELLALIRESQNSKVKESAVKEDEKDGNSNFSLGNFL